MKVLVINAGSSSLKYQLIDMESEQVLAKGNCERIGIGGVITHKTASDVKISYEKDFPTHTEAFKELVKLLSEGENRVVENVGEITAIGQRVVHGGEKFNQSVVIDDEVLKSIEEFSDLAPIPRSMPPCRPKRTSLASPTSIMKNTMSAAMDSTGQAIGM